MFHFFGGDLIYMIYPLVNKEFCVFEHGPVEIVDLPMKNGGSFHRFFLGLKGRVDLSLRQLAIVPVSFCAGFFCTCFLLFLKPHEYQKQHKHTLVGGLEHFLFSPIVGMMIQSD